MKMLAPRSAAQLVVRAHLALHPELLALCIALRWLIDLEEGIKTIYVRVPASDSAAVDTLVASASSQEWAAHYATYDLRRVFQPATRRFDPGHRSVDMRAKLQFGCHHYHKSGRSYVLASNTLVKAKTAATCCPNISAAASFPLPRAQ